jgi:hypothetical protein
MDILVQNKKKKTIISISSKCSEIEKSVRETDLPTAVMLARAEGITVSHQLFLKLKPKTSYEFPTWSQESQGKFYETKKIIESTNIN